MKKENSSLDKIKEITPSEDKVQDKNISAKKGVGFNFRLANIISIYFWFYIITKNIFIDFDILIFQKYIPQYFWVLHLKFFFIIGLAAFF